MAEIIQAERRRVCDFCGKGQEAVKYLIVSPGGAADICESCIAECAEIVAQREASKKTAESTGNAGVST